MRRCAGRARFGARVAATTRRAGEPSAAPAGLAHSPWPAPQRRRDSRPPALPRAVRGATPTTRQPRAAAPASMPAHVRLIHIGSGTMISLPGGARLYNIALATDDSFTANPTSLFTCMARPTETPALG